VACTVVTYPTDTENKEHKNRKMNLRMKKENVENIEAATRSIVAILSDFTEGEFTTAVLVDGGEKLVDLIQILLRYQPEL